MISPSEDHPVFIRSITDPRVQVILAVVILFGILLFNSFFYIYMPYDGMGVYQEDPLGGVYVVDPGGPADIAGVEIGDLILAIAGKSIDPSRSEPRYPPGLKAGDIVDYDFQRGDEEISLFITIGSYRDNLPLLASYLGMQLLSFGLWGIGTMLLLFVRPDDVRARLLSLGFLLAGLTAAVGGASGWNSFWGANTIQQVLLGLLAALLVAAHLTFPTISLARYRRGIIYAVFTLAVALAALVMVDDWLLTPRGYSLFVTYGIDLRQLVLVFFLVAWFVSIALLIYNRFRAQDMDIRRQTGIIIWGMALGIGPFFVFTLLPYLLFGEEFLTGTFTILFLILLPMAYAYVIFQRKLLRLDFIINRTLVWFTLILLILTASTLVFGVFVLLFELPSRITLYGGLVAVLIALPFTSLSKVVQQKVDQVLYGSHYDFAMVTSSMAKQLAQTLDRDKLVELMAHFLPDQMGVAQSDLLLIDGSYLVSQAGDGNPGVSVGDGLCLELLKSHHPLRVEGLWADLPLGSWEKWRSYEWSRVIAPLIFENKLVGLLILGERANGDIYSDQDLRIIATVTEQGALAVANVLLFENQHALAQQLVRSDEEQRKQFASELHDNLLQVLFFIKQGLHQDPGNPELVDYMESSIQNLRQMIKTQRPPLLDQGLSMALEGLVKDVQKVVGSTMSITWQNEITDSLPLSDEQATSIFRITQEALHNAIKHACAQNIAVRVEKNSSQTLRLQVSDDGRGIPQPDPEQRDLPHFGQALMRERAMMIDAALQIQSQPGEGTTVLLEVGL